MVFYKEISVYSNHPSNQDYSLGDFTGYSAQQREIRPFGSTFFLAEPAHSFVIWRVDGRALRLEIQSLTEKAREATVTFQCPARILPDPIFLQDADALHIVLVLQDGSTYHLRFRAPDFFFASQFAVDWLSRRKLTSKSMPRYVVGAKRSVFVATSNGGLLALDLLADVTVENEFKEPLKLSRWLQSLTNSTASEPVSLTAYENPTTGELMILSLCADHRLRAWSAATRNCVADFDLAALRGFTGNDRPPLLSGATGARYMRVVGEEDKPWLVLCLSATFLFYELSAAASSSMELVSLGSKQLEPNMGGLHDFVVSSRGLWVFYDTPREPFVSYLALKRAVSGVVETSFWVDVVVTAKDILDVSFMHGLLQSESMQIIESFVQNLLSPTRFPLQTLCDAYAGYSGTTLTTLPDVDELSLRITEEIMRQSQLAATNGPVNTTAIELLRSEMSRFLTYCVQKYRLQDQGLNLYAHAGLVGLVKTGGCSVISRPDVAELVHFYQLGRLKSPAPMLQSSDPFGALPVELREPALRRDLWAFVQLVERMQSQLADVWSSIELDLFNIVCNPPFNASLDDFVSEVVEAYLAPLGVQAIARQTYDALLTFSEPMKLFDFLFQSLDASSPSSATSSRTGGTPAGRLPLRNFSWLAALLSDSVLRILQARHSLAFSLFLLLLLLRLETQQNKSAGGFPNVTLKLHRVFSYLRLQIAARRVLSESVSSAGREHPFGSPAPSSAVHFMTQSGRSTSFGDLGSLRLTPAAPNQADDYSGPLTGLVLCKMADIDARCFADRALLFSDVFHSVALDVLRAFGFVATMDETSALPGLVRFGQFLDAEMLDFVAQRFHQELAGRRTSATLYLFARCLARLGQYPESEDAFVRASIDFGKTLRWLGRLIYCGTERC